MRILRFGVVGMLNTLVDLGFFNLFLSLDIHPLLATSISYFLATINSYIFNRVWTFGDRRSKKPLFQYSQFLLSNIIGFGLNNLIVYLFMQNAIFDNMTLQLNTAKLVAIVLVVFWNYLVSHFLIFRPHQKEQQ